MYHVYSIRLAGNIIKVGCTTNLKKRISRFHTSYTNGFNQHASLFASFDKYGFEAHDFAIHESFEDPRLAQEFCKSLAEECGLHYKSYQMASRKTHGRVYQIFDPSGHRIYIGSTTLAPKERIRIHLTNPTTKVGSYLRKMPKIRWIESKLMPIAELDKFEKRLIKLLKPLCNSQRIMPSRGDLTV